MREFWKCAFIRAIKTVAQTLASTLPVGFVITPVMIQHADWTAVYVVMAWLATGILAGVASLLTSIATGLPEVSIELEEFDEDAEGLEEKTGEM